MKKASKFLSLNLLDWFKGLLMAIGGAIYGIVAPSIQNGNFTLDWTTIWHTALATFGVYIGKNLLTPTPKNVVIDPSKTSVIDSVTKEPLLKSNNYEQ